MNESKARLGPDHPDTLTSIANLAITYWCQGRLNDAEPLLSQAVKGMLQVMGPEHPTTVHYVNQYNVFLQEHQGQEIAQSSFVSHSHVCQCQIHWFFL